VLLTRGVPLEVLSDLLGHSSTAVTGDIHGHVSPDVAREAIETLGDAFDQSRTAANDPHARNDGGHNGGRNRRSELHGYGVPNAVEASAGRGRA
jgi:hypothetical protein